MATWLPWRQGEKQNVQIVTTWLPFDTKVELTKSQRPSANMKKCVKKPNQEAGGGGGQIHLQV